MKRYLAAMILTITCNAYAGAIETVSETSKIQKILDAIPAKEGTFSTRALTLGITVKSIRVEHLSKADVEGDPFSRQGDTDFAIETNADGLDQDCPILGEAYITKRGGKYLMGSRTANWIVKGLCEAP
ncbi:hypothetical protein [Pseudomonas petrae]|uniref:hypothetical protein n=1 Tax=Pseudomonas petrae TaxID=2912190 RepID=UPI001F31E498|nr:hypothetical protein [Pseudomonas petrae]MCF7536151.1 hypothetical protein [Pseudomonas petrae]